MKGLYILSFIFISICFLFSCTSSSPSDADIATAIAKTNAAIPTSTFTPKASDTPTYKPTDTAEPTPTSTPEPTATPEPSNTPLPPSTWLWSTTLSDFYKEIFDLGYSAEMSQNEDGYWLIYFDDLTSYFESGGLGWYGNSINAWAGKDEGTDGLVNQVSLRKNYLSFPTSEIDGKADRFFRRMLEEFGFTEDAIDEIMQVASKGLVDARNDIEERICFGQLSSGEYTGVRLLSAGYGIYMYIIDIRPSPICEDSSPDEAS